MKARNPSTGNLEPVYVKALDSLPVGTILEFPTTSSAELPNGYMFCDGSAISRTTYSELFSLIGTSYGAGDGSTTFNLPNYKSRVPVGLDSTQTEFDTIGKTGGSKFLQAHKHSYLRQPVSYSELNQGATVLGASSYNATYKNPDAETATAGTGDSGNLQPYIVSNFIIKVKQTVPLAASVLNANSNSTKDTYSCDHINDLMSSLGFDTVEYGSYNQWTFMSDVFVGGEITLQNTYSSGIIICQKRVDAALHNQVHALAGDVSGNKAYPYLTSVSSRWSSGDAELTNGTMSINYIVIGKKAQ